MKEDKDFVYCFNRKCYHTECLRHIVNLDFDILVKINTFYQDNNGNCKDLLLDPTAKNVKKKTDTKVLAQLTAKTTKNCPKNQHMKPTSNRIKETKEVIATASKRRGRPK